MFISLLRVPWGRGYPHSPPSLPSNPHPRSYYPGCVPSPAPVMGQSGPRESTSARVHMCPHCAHNPRPKDRHTDRRRHRWPRAPEAAGSGGEDSGQTPGRTSPASKPPCWEEDHVFFWGGARDMVLSLVRANTVNLVLWAINKFYPWSA